MPLTTRTVFKRDEAPKVDYRQVDEQEFQKHQGANEFLFVDKTEEYDRVTQKKVTSNPFLQISKMIFHSSEQKTYATKSTVRKSGVLKNDVSKISEHGKVALIECTMQDALLIFSSTYHKEPHHQCNFIFLSPPSSAELERRLIRDVERMETTQSIATKVHDMDHALSMSRGIGFINKSFVCEDEKQLLKEAPVYVMHQLYKSHSP